MVPGYREVRQLGAGRTGRVFLATYEQTGAYVAIKYLNATLRRDAEFMDRFRSDTHRLVEIDTPEVVRLYEYVETPSRAAVVMELVDGVSLRTLLAEHGRISPEAALAVVKSTLLALAAAHERGVPHRDVTPGNILVQADGTTKLTDFGIVVHAEEPGVPAGTPEYMAPELWTRGQAGPPADVYAAACVLFEAVRGRPPYRAYKESGDDGGGEREQDVPALRGKHLVEPIPVEVAPDGLRDLLRRGMAKDPIIRYASARQFAAELEEDAVAGYGPDWEKRGRRHLAELATLLALRFPLARTDPAPSNGPRARLPRLPPHLWIAGGAAAAALVAIMLSGGRVPPGPGTILMPPPESRNDPTTATTSPEPTRASPAPRRTSSAPPRATGTAPPTPASPPARPARSGQAGTTAPGPKVRAATILRWNGKAGTIGVSADGTGAVRLRISYTRRDGEGGPALTVRQESRTLRGSTSYTSAVTHDPGRLPCGEQAYVGIVVMTEPAAGNGPQVSEAPLTGPDCPATPSPTTSRPVPSTTQPSPSRSPAPSSPPSDGPAARSSGLTTPTSSRSPQNPAAAPTHGSPEPTGAPLPRTQDPATAPTSAPLPRTQDPATAPSADSPGLATAPPHDSPEPAGSPLPRTREPAGPSGE
ncbi:protein kinase [Nonomuraea sp. NPDC052634]|uniref:serine/threonine-protein kinase n=1 Tax=Nonomuraea sp. NPDC052634 TaxID=3155813 RepID=UPI00344308A6